MWYQSEVCENQYWAIWRLTHLSLVTHICISELGQHWFKYWLVACSAPSHYLNQWRLIVNWTLRNKFQWISIQNTKFLLMEMHLKMCNNAMLCMLSDGRCIIHSMHGQNSFHEINIRMYKYKDATMLQGSQWSGKSQWKKIFGQGQWKVSEKLDFHKSQWKVSEFEKGQCLWQKIMSINIHSCWLWQVCLFLYYQVCHDCLWHYFVHFVS